MTRASELLRRIGVDLRPREAPQVWVLFAYSFLLGVFQFSSKAVRQASFVDSLGAERLPFVYLAVAIAAYPTLRLYGPLASRWSSGRVISVTLFSAAAINGVFWWLFSQPSSTLAFLFYLWIAIAIALTLSQLWSYVNTVLDARQARRLFGFIGSGGLLGGVLGGQLASLASRFEPRHSLLAGALVLVAIAALVLLTERVGLSQRVFLGDEGSAAKASPGRDGQKAEERGGFDAIRKSPHLRLIATILVLSVVVSEVIDLQFNWIVEQATSGLEQRTARFGDLFSLVGLAAFFFQLLITGRIHRTRGVGFAMRVLPLFVLATSLLIGAADLLSLALLGFAVSALKVGDNGLRYSLDHATRELLFLPIRPADRLLAKSYIDVLVHRLAKGCGALLLLTVTFGWVGVLQTVWYTVALSVVWLGCTAVAQRHYLASLRSGLASGSGADEAVDPGSLIDPKDVSTLEVLIESLGSAEPERVLHSLDLLAANDRAHLVPPVLLHHSDPRVRRRTLEVLTRAERRDAIALIEQRISDSEQDVRAAAIQAVASLAGHDGPQWMESRLGDPDPRVRAAAIGCLADQGDQRQQGLARVALERLLADGDSRVRCEAAKALSLVLEPLFQQHLVSLLYDREPSVVLAAISAVRERAASDQNPLYVPILISLLRDRRLKHEARETLFSYGESVVPALAHFMNDPSEHIWVRRALPKTIARFTKERAATTLYQGLESCVDPFLRRKLIEALAGCGEVCDPAQMERLIVGECRRYLETLLQLLAVSESTAYSIDGALGIWRAGTEPSLLERLLDERRLDHFRNLERLLSLQFPGEDIERAWYGLVSTDTRSRGQALEYLDNLLTGPIRRAVMAVIDDVRHQERVELCQRHFAIAARSREQILRQLIEQVPPGDDSGPWLAAAAVHAIWQLKVDRLAPEVRRWGREADDELVRETATWVAARMAGGV